MQRNDLTHIHHEMMATLSLVSRDGMQMTKRHMNRCSTSIPVREMQSRTTVTTSPWSEWPSLKSLQITNAGEGVEKGKLPTLLVGI